MASTTALTLVNRLLRRHGFEDYSAFTLPETLLALDLVNQAIRDLTAVHDYPWNIRSDGVLVTQPQVTTSTLLLTAGSASISDASITTLAGIADNDLDGVCRILPTGADAFNTTALRLQSAALFAGSLIGTLDMEWPGTTQTVAASFLTNEYVLPDTVAKVLSVNHRGTPINLIDVSPHKGFDEVFPDPYQTVQDLPQAIATGGSASSTYNANAVSEPMVGLRLMVWPVPLSTLVLHYSYKQRIADLTTTTSTLTAPSEFADDVVDRAEALSNMTQRFNAPELAQLQMRSSAMSAERKWANSVLDPSRRHSLRPHDTGPRRRTSW